jgi:urocanate hydratase
MEKGKQSFEAMVKTRREEAKLRLKDEARRIEEQAEARKKAQYDHKYDQDEVDYGYSLDEEGDDDEKINPGNEEKKVSVRLVSTIAVILTSMQGNATSHWQVLEDKDSTWDDYAGYVPSPPSSPKSKEYIEDEDEEEMNAADEDVSRLSSEFSTRCHASGTLKIQYR